jgi:hypothetical protein
LIGSFWCYKLSKIFYWSTLTFETCFCIISSKNKISTYCLLSTSKPAPPILPFIDQLPVNF